MKKILLVIFLMTVNIFAQYTYQGINNFPPLTLWAVQDEDDKLYYYVIEENHIHENEEGEIDGISGDEDIEAFTISPDGDIYLMNNVHNSKLYKISGDQVDGDEDTPVTAEYIGNTGLSAGSSSSEITNLQFIDGVLYGISKNNKTVYSIDLNDASVTVVSTLNVNGSFRVDGLTLGSDGVIYLNKTNSKKSELWKFDGSITSGSISKVLELTSSKKIEAIAAHPNGFIYAADDKKLYKIDPITQTYTHVANHKEDIEGMDFYFTGESQEDDPEPEADLSLSKTVSNENPEDGDEVLFTVTLTNNGPDAASNIEVTDELMDGLDFQAYSVTHGTFANVEGNTYRWNIDQLESGVEAVLTVTVQINISAVNESFFDLGVASDYNLFVLEDLIQPSSDTEGKAAVGGDAILGTYSVGYKLPAPDNPTIALLVGEDLEFTTGAVYGGDVVYGEDSISFPINGCVQGSIYHLSDLPVDFDEAKVELKNLSIQLSEYNPTGTTVLEYSKLQLVGNLPGLNVFEVNGDDLTTVSEVLITVPNAAVVLVNISGDNIDWGGGLVVTGTDISNVLYNFYEAEELTIGQIDVTGSILAPLANVNFVSGVQNGQMIAKSVTGSGQFNNVKFVGNVPIDETLTNLAEITNAGEIDPNLENNSAQASVQIESEDNSSLVVGGNGNWQIANSFGEGEIIWTLLQGSGSDLYAGTWGGIIYGSNDLGVSWSRINPDMNVAYVWALAEDQNFLFAGTEQGLYKKNTQGAWNLIAHEAKDVRALVTYQNSIYAGVWGYGIFESTDNGANWNHLGNESDKFAVQDIIFNPNGEMFVATFNDGVYKYSSANNKFTKLTIDYSHIWSLGVTSTGGLFAGTYGNGLYHSTDNGENWQHVFDVTASYIYSISVDQDDHVYASSWTTGVFVLTEALESGWMPIGMGGFGVSCLLNMKDSQSILAGTKNGELFRNDSPLTSVSSEIEIPAEFNLSQNYPNPFNPSTIIEFSIPQSEFVSIKVFNLIGEEVATLLNKEMNGGAHKVKFNPSNLSSGIYFYQISAGDFNEVKKMILLK